MTLVPILVRQTYWAPVVNLAREPRWGRNLECAGEDPYLSGEYAAAFVGGFEHLEEEPRYLAASACCKHYAANSMEDSRVAGVHHTRYSADPNITQRDLVDSYLAPFQARRPTQHLSRSIPPLFAPHPLLII
jgi:beta-glucosidase-like glycosyl hydrolase